MITEKDGLYCWKGSDNGELLSYHLKAGEFACLCPACRKEEQRIAVALVQKLEAVRKKYGHAITITSGYRCGTAQEALRSRGFETAKGVSQHELGNAADIHGADIEKLHTICSEFFSAIGRGRTWLHVDLRDDKERHWTYKL